MLAVRLGLFVSPISGAIVGLKIATDFEISIERENLPEIGDRLPQFDRQTFRDLIGNRSDISQKDLDRISERIQQEAKLRVEEVKRQAQRQAEDSRKAGAVASWWLFFTAFISAIASASAGVLGVVD